jgi:alkylation response protein AidB-like acyl-CoA dehydrogenase
MMQLEINSATETAERKELRSNFRRLLARSWSDEHVRERADGKLDNGEALRSALRDGMGLYALTVPEEHGGLGGGLVEAAIAAEELGAAMAPSRLLTATMMARLLMSSRDRSLAGLLERTVADNLPGAVLWPGDDATWDVTQISAAAVTGSVVQGTFAFVPEVDRSGFLLCPAAKQGRIGLAVLEPPLTAGVEIRNLRPLDLYRPLDDITLAAGCEWFDLAAPVPVFTETVAAGSIVLAAEMIGGARACLERMVTYAQQRRQFGKPIGTFQALKHRMVDVLVAWEAARALTYRAAAQFDDAVSRGQAAAENVSMVRMAKSAASDALRIASAECIQVHGGIGFTWENPVHLYLKRWATSARLFGSPDQHRLLVYRSANAAPGDTHSGPPTAARQLGELALGQ